MIQAVREIKTQYNIKPSAEVDVIIKDVEGNVLPCNNEINAILNRMCKATWLSEQGEGETVSRTILKGTLEILLADIINVEEEIAKCEKELSKLTGEIKRCEGMLNNPNFLNKAPANKIEEERNKLANYQAKIKIANERLEAYKNN